MEDSRTEILSLLQRKPGLTIDELAQSFDLAAGTVRRHLDILQRDRLVDCRSQRRDLGRPVFVFSLTEDGQERLPKDYQRLSTQIVRQLAHLPQQGAKQQSGVALLESVFSTMSQEVVARYQAQLTDKKFAERVAVLQSILTNEHFAPEMEAGPEGLSIHLHNCPFRSTALENPSVCNYDSQLIAQVLKAVPDLPFCITQGDVRCSYFVPRTP